jgi:hypothetical protein
VITLELLWRGHLQALGEMNEQQRLTYQRVLMALNGKSMLRWAGGSIRPAKPAG